MRRVLTAAIVAGAGLLVGVATPALSVRPPAPRAVDFELAVHASAGARTAGALAVTTPALRAPHRFDLLGFRWSSAGRVDVRVRVRTGRRWSRWVTAQSAEDHGGDRGPPLRGTDPVWAGGADAFQLRLSRPVRGLRVHFVNVTGTKTAVDRARTAVRRIAHAAMVAIAASAARAQGAAGPPEIVPRAAWGADQCPPRVEPSYGQVQLAFVHHTVTANDYAPDDSAAMVLAICRYHRNANGWNDIGYNFLVDRYGKVFEGRAGGVDQAVVGAQAQGYNTQSTGIANLGTYGQAPVSDAALGAMARLIGWKLPLHGAPVSGTVTVVSAGGSDNRHPSGTPVTFDRIAGHRDGDATECPGDALYAQLPALRSLAAQGSAPPAAPTALTLSAARSRVRFPAAASLAGRLTLPDGTPLAGAAVRVEAAIASTFRPVTSALTADDGSWSASVAVTSTSALRASYPGDGAHAAVTSPAVSVGVVPRLGARALARRVRAGHGVLVAGALRPARAAVVVRWARAGASGAYGRAAARRVPLRSGRLRVRIPLRRPGLYRLRVVFAGDAGNLPVRSRTLYVRAVRR
jgi:N-acetylmuramoyl-L-alanine amidase